MKKKIWIGIGVVLALALLAWAFMPQPLDVEIAGVSRAHAEKCDTYPVQAASHNIPPSPKGAGLSRVFSGCGAGR